MSARISDAGTSSVKPGVNAQRPASGADCPPKRYMVLGTQGDPLLAPSLIGENPYRAAQRRLRY